MISADADAEDSTVESARSIPDTMIETGHTDNIIRDDRGKDAIASTEFTKVSSPSRIRIKCEDNAAESCVLRNALKSRVSDANHHARRKRSAYFSENLARSDAADPENAAIAREAINQKEKQEDGEEYLDQSAEEVKGDYNDREEDVIEETAKAVEDEREGSSPRRKFDPIKARVNMMIKQRLGKKNKHKNSNSYERKKRDTLHMIEYYDYDADGEQERDVPVNKQKIKIKADEFSSNNDAKIKRDDEMKSEKPRQLGKKKNLNEEAVLKMQREKERRKNKEPKEQIIVNLGERRNKTTKNDLDQRNKNPLAKLNFESVFNERGQVSTRENSEKLRQNEDAATDIVQENAENVKSKW